LGHATEMAKAAKMGIKFNYGSIPFVSGAHKYGQMWAFPGGASDNRAYFHKHIQFDPSLEEYEQMLLFDPQTSGGLMIGIAPGDLPEFLEAAKAVDQPAWVVGEVTSGSIIEVVR